MRLAPLLAQYLYLHKRLELPGLGIFTMQPTAAAEPENSRHSKTGIHEEIIFENKPSIKESPELVNFITSQTGKIKALAAADLNSHLELAHQFLNIGKPFSLEGIGSIEKIRSGEFVFSPGPLSPELKKEHTVREHEPTVQVEDNPSDYDYKNIFYPKQVRSKWKKPVAIFLLVAGLVFAIWGGYTVYKKTKAKKDNPTVQKKPVENIPSETTTVVKDNVVSVPDKSVIPAGTFKFVLENSNASRAFPRFSRLKTFQWNVQMETSDSINFKIFMLLPASDTTRIIDSLSMLTGRKVYIE